MLSTVLSNMAPVLFIVTITVNNILSIDHGNTLCIVTVSGRFNFHYTTVGSMLAMAAL